LLPVTVSEDFLKKIFIEIEKDPATVIEVNLQEQLIKIASTGEQERFDINSYKKTCLLNGYDDIDYLISIKKDIEQFEIHQP
jgi:3-isopropylmalate/(R)-2-methylmalate dehydratase small subunit